MPGMLATTSPLWFPARLRTWLREHLGLDKAIGYTILGRAWSSLAGLVTVALIAHLLSPAEQGYYYTFGSLIALQIIFELGFSFVILQMASHERAHLTISDEDEISGDPVAHDRLASVLQKTVRWYTAGAIFLAVSLILAGSHFFHANARSNVVVPWQIPWYVTAIAATLTFQIDPVLSFLEGCGFVARIARVRVGQAVLGSSLAWLALITHHGLFAPALVMLGNASFSAAWLSKRRRLLLPLMRRRPGANTVHWSSEVWPFQWRIAVSWLCGYFIFQLYNPVLFAYDGAVVAGQMGMSLTLTNALMSVSIAWINTKAAPFGGMIARGEFDELDHHFFRALIRSTGVCCLGASVIWLADFVLNKSHSPLAHRLVDPTSLAFLLGTAPLNAIAFGQAMYLRAHKQEKFLLNSILGAALVGTSTIVLGKFYGVRGVVMGSFASGVLVGLPMGTYTFMKYRRLWHAA